MAADVWTDKPDAPLYQPPVLSSGSTGHLFVQLNLSIVEYTSAAGVAQRTRAFNGRLIGPTIRVRPGDTLRIRLQNLLERETCADRPELSRLYNNFRLPNHTSLHLHGMHVSPLYPSDDPFRLAQPGGGILEHVFRIPDDHAAGTYWYHPHAHGAAMTQVGGGAHGMLVVEEAAAAIPPPIARLEERSLVLLHFRQSSLRNFALAAQRACRAAGFSEAECDDPIWAASDGAAAAAAAAARANKEDNEEAPLLVNGLTRPRIDVHAREWQRWRLLLVGYGGAWFYLTLPNCEVQLLAKDGVYLPVAPRPVSTALLASGARADLLVRCPAGTHTLHAEARGHDYHGPTSSTVARVHAVESSSSSSSSDLRFFTADGGIKPFRPPRPLYLSDLSGGGLAATSAAGVASRQKIHFQNVTLNFGMAHGSGGPTMYDINGQRFNRSAEPLVELEVGSIVELSVVGLGAGMGHVYHQHVNPFQLVDEPTATVGNYFRKGDWHDTIRGPKAWGWRPLRVRFQTDRFTGPQLMHCHYLWHEDRGMIAVARIRGEEGRRIPADKAATMEAEEGVEVAVRLPAALPSDLPVEATLRLDLERHADAMPRKVADAYDPTAPAAIVVEQTMLAPLALGAAVVLSGLLLLAAEVCLHQQTTRML